MIQRTTDACSVKPWFGQFCLAFASCMSLASVLAHPCLAEDIVVEDCYVSPLNDVDVPAEAQGVIRALDVDEGHTVVAGETLATIDDREAQINKDLAKIELEKASEQAANDVRIRYAREDAKVSASELDAARTANQRQPGTFGEAEMRKMRLQLSRSTLGIEQAELDQKDYIYARESNKVKLRAAEEEIGRRNIEAPFDGVIVDIQAHKGEWVNPGDPLLRLVQMDRLSIDGFLNVKEDRGRVQNGMPVIAMVETGAEKFETRGKVSFISPLVQAGGNFRVRVEVENTKKNDQWMLRPGLPATFRIPVQ
ncbi:MAG: HlyD family efflux transporter periplasmic adaptor subunit [Planctomycetota bacterium]|nr:HlyD family efflux transporter periplasmic adaptor subunit [Planctomycetota bacterium]